jgi:hypothetical protein
MSTATTPSGAVGIYLADASTVCCLCDSSVPEGDFVKEIGVRFACMPCVDKALVWIVGQRDKKRGLVSAN